MGYSHFKPWGDLDWLVGKLNVDSWDLFGCISFEDRCTGVIEKLLSLKLLNGHSFVKINDPISEYSDTINSKMQINEVELQNLLKGINLNISEVDLLGKSSAMVDTIESFIESSSSSIIIDISCLPKRFFFPLIKLCIKSSKIQNLIITYGSALKYTNKPLSEDPEPWGNIPLFGEILYPEPEPKHAMVGVGFIPFGLSRLLKDKYGSIPVTFFFPCPPSNEFYQRGWEFLRTIEQNYRIKDNDEILRIDPLDVSDVYNHIVAITDNGKEPAIFAPYGPKPMSIAMAIYATLTDSPVYYTQPKKYNPDYSSGKGNINAYLVKQEGSLVFDI